MHDPAGWMTPFPILGSSTSLTVQSLGHPLESAALSRRTPKPDSGHLHGKRRVVAPFFDTSISPTKAWGSRPDRISIFRNGAQRCNFFFELVLGRAEVPTFAQRGCHRQAYSVSSFSY